MKRGQVTLFIIIGIVLVFIVAFIFIVVPKKEKTDTEKERVEIINYIDNCLSSVSDNALFLLGKQGRIYPKSYIITNEGSIEYYYFEGKNNLVSLNELEQEVSDYIKKDIDNCIDNFDFFNYKVEKKEPKVTTSFKKYDTYFEMEYPILINIGESQIEIKNFYKRSDLRIRYMYEYANEIVDNTVENKKILDTNFIISKDDIRFKLYPIDEEKVVYEITDQKRELNGEPYKYRFALKFKW